MIIVMSSRDENDVRKVVSRVEEMGYMPHVIRGVERTVVAAVGDDREKHRLTALESLPCVEKVVPILEPYKLVSRSVRPDPSVIECGGVKIGAGHFAVVAGPCSVESKSQIQESARIVKDGGAHLLRGGAYKPRTSPYAFQGLEEEGLKLLRAAGDAAGIPVVTEVMAPDQVHLVEEYADMLQVGARNMQNFSLLREVGRARKPVFLKRGMAATIKELLMSAEYILSEGNPNVILCERGIRTFETATRNTLDIQAVPVLKRETHLPVVVDPSHSSGDWELVAPMAKAAVAAGADGIMIEVHPRPEEAFSDGPQSLTPEHFRQLMEELKPYLALAGKTTQGGA
ncbi:MAG: 3-deoxy-7-phosphoheptulonate synthase [Candidatus Hydrogenedens sp.]|nr:3-deoxy-7-phosphoheptulonate synthase [Candidatus Hydrogenedens sp.]